MTVDPDGRPRRTAFLVPHTHWDREWHEPFAVFTVRMAEMLDSVLDQMRAEPEFRHFHLDGQSVLIDDYLRLRPERAGEVADRITSGALSIGPMYTLADTFLASGESLFRNLELGLESAAAFGVERPPGGPWAVYLPDQFGFAGQVPQVVAEFGIGHVVLLRGVPAAIDQGVFRWTSPDGSSVLTEYMIDGYYAGLDFDVCADVDATAAELTRVMGEVGARTPRRQVLVPVGSDHYTPRAGMFERAHRAGAVTDFDIRIGSLAEFLTLADAVHRPLEWTGELRAASTWVLLPNTVSTRTPLKRRRGPLEIRLERYIEPLFAVLDELEWPAAELDRAWRLMLENANHDAAYGACADATAAEVAARFDEVEAILDPLLERAVAALAARSALPGVLRWNPSPFERDGVPGMSWSVVERRADVVPAEMQVRDLPETHLVCGDLRIGFELDDDDGDLFTFSPAPDGHHQPTSVRPLGQGSAIVAFDGVEIEVRLSWGEAGVLLVDGTIRNDRDDHRLRCWVGLDDTVERAVAGSIFELVERPLVGEGFESERPSPTWPASGAVLAGTTAIVADHVFEYEIHDGKLAVTLLRAVGEMAQPELPTRPIWAGPPLATPDGQCRGEHPFRLGVMHGVARGDLLAVRERVALPILEVPTSGGGDRGPGCLLQIDGAEISAIRRGASGIDVRIWNPTTEPVRAIVGGRPVELGPSRIESVTS